MEVIHLPQHEGFCSAINGDVQAVRCGPEPMGKRLMRRAAGKVTGSMLGKWFRERLEIRGRFSHGSSTAT